MNQVLPTYYLITPDYTGDLSAYLANLQRSLDLGVQMVQLRSKNLSTTDYADLANHVLPLIKRYQAKIIFNAPINFLADFAGDGIHLPSCEYAALEKRPVASDILFSVACHNASQVQHAMQLDVDFIVLCPVFATPSSPQGIPLGWSLFESLVKSINCPVYALGGLSLKDYPAALSHGAYGIAAKRALWNLTAPLSI